MDSSLKRQISRWGLLIFGINGGIGIIPFGWDFVVIAIVNMILLYLAVKMRLPESNMDALID